MKRVRFGLFLLIFGTVFSAFGRTGEDPYKFSSPADWRSERITFPLSFAPTIKYDGYEELRFAPGMFKPGSETYFTYAFFWWVKDRRTLTERVLKSQLEAYFKGLCREVGKERKLKIDLAQIVAKVERLPERVRAGTRDSFQAEIACFDPFNGGQPLRLRSEIISFYCEKAGHTCMFFIISPRLEDSRIKDQLLEIRSSFECK